MNSVTFNLDNFCLSYAIFPMRFFFTFLDDSMGRSAPRYPPVSKGVKTDLSPFGSQVTIYNLIKLRQLRINFQKYFLILTLTSENSSLKFSQLN